MFAALKISSTNKVDPTNTLVPVSTIPPVALNVFPLTETEAKLITHHNF